MYVYAQWNEGGGGGGGGCYTQFMAEKCVQQQDQTKKNEKYHQQINCQLLKGH